jgi:HSP20 family protein
MSEITRRAPLPFPLLLGDLLDPFHLLSGGRPQMETYGIRIETQLEDGAYLVRAELPGIEPDKDVEVTIADGTLAIHAERSDHLEQKHHTEFRYGSYTRTLPLPEGAKQDEITADYKGGILTVRIPVEEAAKPAARKIMVQPVE